MRKAPNSVSTIVHWVVGKPFAKDLRECLPVTADKMDKNRPTANSIRQLLVFI